MNPQIVSANIPEEVSITEVDSRETSPTMDAVREGESADTVSVATAPSPSVSTKLQQAPEVVDSQGG